MHAARRALRPAFAPRRGAPLLDAEQAFLREAFTEHGLLVVQAGALSDARPLERLAPLGRVEPDEDGLPMRMEVTNQHGQTTAPDDELVFHYDDAYDAAPISALSMYGAVVEGDVTPTLFASSAYRLRRATRSSKRATPRSTIRSMSIRIDGSHTICCYGTTRPWSMRDRSPGKTLGRSGGITYRTRISRRTTQAWGASEDWCRGRAG